MKCKNNHQDLLNNGCWYNTYICLKLHENRFNNFNTHARAYKYNLMFSLVPHNKLQPDHKYDEIIIGDTSIPDDTTPKALEALGTTINLIDIWLKLILENYNARCDAYINAMKDMFKEIPQTMTISRTPKKVQRLMTDIGGGCYIVKSDKGLPPLRRNKLS